MKLQSTKQILGLLAVLALLVSTAAADKNAPEKKPGYDKTKDVGAAAPKGQPLGERITGIELAFQLPDEPSVAGDSMRSP